MDIGRRQLIQLAAVSVASSACNATIGAPPPKGPDTNYPAWAGPYEGMYDDAFSSTAAGMNFDGAAPGDDPMLRYRVVTADLIARVRIQTLTQKTGRSQQWFVLGIQVGYPTLVPAVLKESMLELPVYPTSPSYNLVRTLGDDGLRSKTFIAFVKQFTGQGGRELHWHLAADTGEVAAAVQQHAVFAPTRAGG